MLGSHTDIHTLSEPWLMLPPLYALRPEKCVAEYDTRKSYSALLSFLDALPRGEEEYFEGVRRMYGYLYGRALAASGGKYFLDKTPRYYFIIPELHRTFPEAHFIILLRNPLAVLCSILKTWVREDWFRLSQLRHDLTQAPSLLLKGISLSARQVMTIHYEELVNNPENEVRCICDRLGINLTPGMIEYGNDKPDWRFGDHKEIHKHTRPTPENVDKWIQAVKDPQIWRLTSEYLELLGLETVEQMGYNYQELRGVLDGRQPHGSHLRLTFPLAWLLDKPQDERRRWERDSIRLIRSLQRHGFQGAASALAWRILCAVQR